MAFRSHSAERHYRPPAQHQYQQRGQHQYQRTAELQFQRVSPREPRPQYNSASPREPRPQYNSASPREGRRQYNSTSPRRPQPQYNSGPPREPRPQYNSASHREPRRQYNSTSPRRPQPQYNSAPPRRPQPQYNSAPPREPRPQYNSASHREPRPQYNSASPRRQQPQYNSAPPREPRPQYNSAPPREPRPQYNSAPPREPRPQHNSAPPRRPQPQYNSAPPRQPRPQYNSASHREPQIQDDSGPPRKRRRRRPRKDKVSLEMDNRIKANEERVKKLEEDLKKAREGAVRDQYRLREVDRLREFYMQDGSAYHRNQKSRLQATEERAKKLEATIKNVNQAAVNDRNRVKEFVRLKAFYRMKESKQNNQGKGIRPGPLGNANKTKNGTGQASAGSSDLQGSQVIESQSPSKNPDNLPEDNADIGESGVSKNKESATGSEALPKPNRGYKPRRRRRPRKRTNMDRRPNQQYQNNEAKRSRPEQEGSEIKIENGTGQESPRSSDLQGSDVIRSHSPSEIPIISSGGDDCPTAVISFIQFQGEGEPDIGEGSLSQMTESVIEYDAPCQDHDVDTGPAEPIQPEQQDNEIEINNGTGQASAGTSDLQGSEVIEYQSPSQIPIVLSEDDPDDPDIFEDDPDIGEDDPDIGEYGVSERIESAIEFVEASDIRSDLLGSVVMQPDSPSETPIILCVEGDQPVPDIGDGQRDDDPDNPDIGGCDVSQGIESDIGSEALPTPNSGYRPRRKRKPRYRNKMES